LRTDLILPDTQSQTFFQSSFMR